MLEFFADDSLGRKSESIPIKDKRSFDVIDAKGQQGYAWLHLCNDAEFCPLLPKSLQVSACR